MALFQIYIYGFLGGSVVMNLPANAGDAGLIPGLGTFPGEGNSNPLQYSCLEIPMDRGIWQATIYRVAKSQIQLKQLSMHAHVGIKNMDSRFQLPGFEY